MPLDPIISNPTMAKFADPAETYGNALKNAFLMQQIDEMKQKREDTDRKTAETEAMRKAMSGPVDPKLGERGTTRNALRTAGFGHLVPKLDLDYATIDDKQADADKKKADMTAAKVKAIADKMGLYSKAYEGVSDDPNIAQHQIYSIVQREAKDDDIKDFIGPDHVANETVALHAAMQSPEAFRKYLDEKKMGAKDASEKALKLAERAFQVIDQKDKKTLLSLGKYQKDGDPETVGTFVTGKDPNAHQPITNIVVNAEKKASDVYETERKKHQAELDNAKQDIAAAAPQAIADIQRMRALIKSGKPLTGTGATAFEKLASMGKTIGVDVVPPDRLQATQEARIFLSTTMLQNIAQLRHSGVALGAITEKEFEQLMASAPKITDQPEVIDAWLARAQNNYARMAKEFNDNNAQRLANPHTAPYERAVPPNNIPMAGPGGQVPVPPTPPAGPPPVVKAHSNDAGFQKIVELLKQGRISKEGFDRKYGAGAAAQVLGQPGGGGTPTGGAPFPPGR